MKKIAELVKNWLVVDYSEISINLSTPVCNESAVSYTEDYIPIEMLEDQEEELLYVVAEFNNPDEIVYSGAIIKDIVKETILGVIKVTQDAFNEAFDNLTSPSEHFSVRSRNTQNLIGMLCKD